MKKQLFAIFGIVLIGFSLLFSCPVQAISEEETTPDIDIEQVIPTPEAVIKTESETIIEQPKTEEIKPETNIQEKNPQTLATVATYNDFVDAMNNTAVDQIEVTADINGMGGSTKRINAVNRSLSINANNHKLNIGSQFIPLTYIIGGPANHTLKLSNANISNNNTGEGFANVIVAGLGRWNLEFTNITAEKGSVNRVSQAQRCVVTMRGNNNINTYYENFELGSFTVAEDATYIGNNYGTDSAIIDYTTASLITDTAAKRQFLMGDRAKVNFTTSFNANGKASWPPIWGFYKAITLGVDSVLKVKWGCDIIRANGDTAATFGEYPLGLTVLLKSGSTMDLDNTEHHDYPAINMDLGTNSITMEPGATLKATSDGIYGALAFDGGINKFYANQPKLVDLKNRRDGYKAFITTVGADTDFTIDNTDVAYWASNIDDDNNPTASFAGVKKINSKITNKWSSDPPEVATALTAAKVQRFATKYVEKGSLSISEVPANVSFGTDLKIPEMVKVFRPQSVTGALKITDTRLFKQNWQLGVTILKDMTGANTGHILDDALFYQSSLGNFQLNKASTIVEKHKNVDNDYLVSGNWGEAAGPYLLVMTGAVADTYGGDIRWDIRDVPA